MPGSASPSVPPVGTLPPPLAPTLVPTLVPALAPALPPGCRPPTAEEEAGLRRVVGGLAAVSGRRPTATVVHVGRPAGSSQDFVVVSPAALDSALRTEVVAALLGRAGSLFARPALWVTRSGGLATEDLDLDWYAAARAAYGEAGVPLLMVVATRHGWYAPGTGHRRAWRRLRLDR